MPRNTRNETSKRNDAPNSAPMQSSDLIPEPLGLEKIWADQFIERISDAPSSKVTLCALTATYARNGWQFPKRLNQWTAAVMSSLAEGKRPFSMPRGKCIPVLEIVVFVKRLQTKGYELAEAKQRAKNQFQVGMPAINRALRLLPIDPDLLPFL